MSSLGHPPYLKYRPAPTVAWRVQPWDAVLVVAVITISSVAVWQSTILGRVPDKLQSPLSAAWAVRSGQPVQYDGPPLLAVLLVPLAQGSEAMCLPAGPAMLMWCVTNSLLLWSCYRGLGMRGLFDWRLLLLLPCVLSLGHGGLEVLSLWLALQLDAAMDEGDAFPAGLWFAALLIVQPLALLLLLALQPGKTMQLATFVGLFLGCIVLPAWCLGLEETSRLNRHYLELIQLQLLTWPTLGLVGLTVFTVAWRPSSREAEGEARLQRLRVTALVLSTGGLVNLLNLAAWVVSWINVKPAVVDEQRENHRDDEQPLARAA